YFHGLVHGGRSETSAVGTITHAPNIAAMPLEGPDLFPRRHFPHLDRGILAAGGRALAIGANAHAPYGGWVSVGGEEFLAGCRVPHPDQLRGSQSEAFSARAKH